MQYIIFFFFLLSCNSKNGLNIHKSCVDINPNLNKVINESIEKGFRCLDRLKSPKSKSFYNNIYIERSNVEFTCLNKLKKDTIARANSPALNNTSKNTIEINYNFVLNSKKMQRTIFHELLHLDGTRHYVDIEYPYACEHYCFADKVKFKSEINQIAQSICQGDFSKPESKNYVVSVTKFFLSTTDDFYSKLQGLSNYIIHNPNNTELRDLFLKVLMSSEANFIVTSFSNTEENLELKVKSNGLNSKLTSFGEYAGEAFRLLFKKQPIDLEKLIDKFDLIDESDLHFTEKQIYQDLSDIRGVILVTAYKNKLFKTSNEMLK